MRWPAREPKDPPLPWRRVFRVIDRLAVELGLLPTAPDLDDDGRPLHDRAAVNRARKRLLDAWDRENPGDPIMPDTRDLDRLAAFARRHPR